MTRQAQASATATSDWVAVFGQRPAIDPPAQLTFGSETDGNRVLEIVGDGRPRISSAADHTPWHGVFFDGVLDDRSTLAEELEIDAAQTSDATMLRRAYEQWGLDLLARVRGAFALLVWDGVENRLVAARDPLGAYPLFYAHGSVGRLLLSKSIDALVDHPEVSRTVNRASLADHLCHRWPDSRETFFNAVKRVPPGHVLIAAGSALRVDRYWDPAPVGRSVAWVSEDELSQFDDRFEAAVQRGLNRGRAGIFLSGGLDSISVAAVAADLEKRANRPAPVALSLGFPDLKCNEEVVQRGVAAALGLDQEFVPFDDAIPRQGLLAAALENTRTWPAPVLNAWGPAYAHLALRGKRRGVHTILTGAGGDEWLAVSPYFAADLLRRGDFSGLVRLVSAWCRSYRLSPLSVFRTTLWTFGARPLAGLMLNKIAPGAWQANRFRRAVRKTPAWVAPDRELRALLDKRVEASLTPSSPPTGFYFHDVRTSLDHALTCLELEEMFEMGRRLGVRILNPYWDADVVDMLYRTPPLLLCRDGRAKSLVRETVARRFPGLGLEHQRKIAGTSFRRSLLEAQIPKIWRAAGGVRALTALGIVDGRKADAMVERSIAHNDHEGLNRTWDLLNVNAWVESRS